MRLGIFISGSGTNMEAILEHFQRGYFSKVDEISFVLSDSSDAFGLRRAQAFNIRTLVVEKRRGEKREAYESRIVEAISPFKVDMVALAGFMKILSPFFLEKFHGTVLNIHPSLLPAFPGLNAQKQAFDYGVKITGCTVHYVDSNLDGGPIILQRSVERFPGDDCEALRLRILVEEHKLYSEAIEIVSVGKCRTDGRYVEIKREKGDEI